MDENSFEDEPPTPLPPDQQAGDLPQIDLESGGPGPPSRRKRAIQISLVLVALLALLVTLRGVLQPPPAPPAPPPGPPSFTVIVSNISFGRVTIDGQQQRGTVPMLLAERAPSYTITINAPPFLPKSCAFSFGNGASLPTTNNHDRNCAVEQGIFPETTFNGVTGDPSSMLLMLFTAADLPSDQQNQLNALLVHSVTVQQTATAPVGSYIATGLTAADTVTSQLISAPVQATELLAPSTTPNQGGINCGSLTCLVHYTPAQVLARAGMLWDIDVPLVLHWRFTTTAGSVLGDVFFPTATIVPTTLAYSFDTGWSVPAQSGDSSLPGQLLSDLNCDAGVQIVQYQLTGTYWNVTTYEAQGIQGCQVIMTATDGSSQAEFIWRFGVLLAADNEAHNLMPRLPIAPQEEIKAVQG